MTQKSAAKMAARAAKAEKGGKYEEHLRRAGGIDERKPKPWTCDVCKKPIAPKHGAIVLIDNGGPTSDDDLPHGLSNEEYIDALLRPNAVQFAAYHDDCEPEYTTNTYPIEVSRAATLEDWCAWTDHVSEKTWMGKSDIVSMLTFWFRNRSVSIHDYAK